ncbi:RNA-guided endonuclease InsQ/TnpB family protein [Planktothrix prolifica]|uniref:RNA-guided endonuclease InsQ/TnpB family protein n=1 Tax=Planktothrix prolifica TaxID=54307 RepID=UPI00047AA57C|nr:RNA-guided endonuclease TnpB family protein [Planktothrix prolifica]
MIVLEYKCKGKPNQYKAIDEAICTTQFIRNKAIRYWMDSSRDLKIDKFALNKYSTTLRNEFPFVADLNSMAVQSAAERGWSAISRFYDNCKLFGIWDILFCRKCFYCRSVEYKTSGWKLHPTKRQITLTDKNGIGKVKLLGKWDIHTYNVKDIKRVRLIRRADGYYAQFCLNINVTDIQPKTGKEIGLDVGIESFYTDSNGYKEPNPKFLRKAEKSIKQSQRQIYKKVKGSSGRRKVRKVYAKKHLKVSRQRIEHAKRIARNVCKSNDLVVYEDLSVRNLLKNHCLAKSITDASWYLFRKWVEYFAAKFDKLAIPVAPHYTSQKCSNCGVIVKKSLSTRTHVCNCGCELHRDTNAAINILNLGKQARGGHPQSNANGLETSTPLDESLVEQVSRLKLESQCLQT